MALNRDKFRKIVGGITSEPEAAASVEALPPAPEARTKPIPRAEGQGVGTTGDADNADAAAIAENRRFAKRGRPKSRREEEPTVKTRKVKVSLFLNEELVNDLYEWAHADKIHPGEMFERALKPFHEKEAKRRKG
jgi:hypothetical protein